MAKPGDIIENPRIGARTVFMRTGAETDGQLLETDLFFQPNAPPSVSTLSMVAGMMKFGSA